MTFLNILCRVCAWFVHSFVQGLFACKSPIFRASRYFVHGVHSNARTYACGRVRVCAHTHTYAYTRMHKPCTLCTFSYFPLKNNGIKVFKTVNKLFTNPALVHGL